MSVEETKDIVLCSFATSKCYFVNGTKMNLLRETTLESIIYII